MKDEDASTCKIQIFADVSEETLVDIATATSVEHLHPNEVVFEKDSWGTSMYIVARGRVRVHDEVHTIAELGEREVFGELAAIIPEPRLASVTAIEETTLFRINNTVLAELLADNFQITEGIIRVLCHRIRKHNMEVSSLPLRD